MIKQLSSGLAIVLLALMAFVIGACQENAFGPPFVASVTLTFGTTTVTSADTVALAQGSSVQLTATARDENGVAFTGPTVSWSSSDPDIVAVSSDGVLTGAAQGTATATASIEEQSASVSVLVTAGPVLSLSAQSVAFNASGSDPPPQNVIVGNAGGGSLGAVGVGAIQYNPGEPIGWLTTAINVQQDTLTLFATVGSLPQGTYQAVLPVSADSAMGTQSIDVTLSVQNQILIALSDSNPSFGAAQGGADPASQAITVTLESGGSAVGVTAGAITYNSGSNWLTISVAGNTITVQPSVASLTQGTYVATFPVSAAGASNSPVVTVTFNVGQGAILAVTPNMVSFGAASGGVDPPGQSVTVSNSGTGTLTGVALGTTTYGGGQPTGWLNANLAGLTVTLQASVGSLGSGSYTATVPVTATNVPNSPQNISVTFNVVPPGSDSLRATTTTSLTGTVNTVVAPNPTVIVVDATGSPRSGVTVTFAPSAGSVSQASVQTNASGIASTSWTLGTAAGTQNLTASVPGAIGSPATFTATANPGPATQLVITSQPPPSAQNTITFSTSPTVGLRDAFGNNVSQAGQSVTVQIASGGGTLGGTTTRTTNSSGSVSFTGLSITGLIGNRTLSFASGGLSGASSNTISLTAGPANHLHVATQPGGTIVSNQNFPVQPAVQVHDVSENNVSGTLVTATENLGNGLVQGSTSQASLSNGIATYSDLRINGGADPTLGTGSHRLSFSASGVSSINSAAFPVRTSLSYNVQPIFSANCATSGCHDGQPPIMTTDSATHVNTVNVSMIFCGSGTRIVPGDTATSELFIVATGTPCNSMPIVNLGPLLGVVSAWIKEGANNN